MSVTAKEGSNARLTTAFLDPNSQTTTQHFHYHYIDRPHSTMNATEQATLASSIELQEKLEKLIICQGRIGTFAVARLTPAS